ncbi:MAG: hypothetical protein R3C45_06375 [Phycisphaerales bacterium]
MEPLTLLKFFRKYNKWILGVGGSLLMIVFLIQPVMSMFQPDIDGQVRGTFDGGELTLGDIKSATGDLSVLRQFGLLLDTDPDEPSGNRDPIRWALILKDAQRLGLNASMREVDQLQLETGRSDADIELLASRLSATPGYIRHAMKNWLIVQSYKELLAGQSHTPGNERAAMMRQMLTDQQSSGFYEAMAYGTSRLSKPLVEHFLQDQGASVEGRAVVVNADRFIADTAEPTGEEVASLYEQYKDALPGRGKPYGFGYRVPDRVKVEYLSIPMDLAQRVVKVTEADALAHYRKYPERFTSDASFAEGAKAEPKPYDQVREDVIKDLTDQLAFELVEKMAKAAYGYFYEDTRGMAKEDDYRVVGDLTKLKTMREVAERLEKEFGLLPEIRSADGAWVSAAELSNLPGIGQSRLADNINVDFRSFVLSAKELKPDKENPLLPRRLQVGLVGAPMIGIDATRYLFRLTDAQSTRLPESLDEVRDQATKDARLLSAYKKLLADKDTWLSQAVTDGLEKVAESIDTTVVPLPATSRRVALPNGLLIVPPLPGVGQSEAFIEAYFQTANNAQDLGGVSQASADVTTGAVGLDTKLALALYQVDSYEPLTEAEFKERSNIPTLPLIVDMTLLAPARMENPLSLKALTHRLNYDDGNGEEEAADGDTTPDGAGSTEG